VKVAEVSALLLVNVMTNREVLPAGIEVGENVLETDGTLAVTVSTSLTEQTPVDRTHPVTTFVLVTPDGGVIEAVFVICV
jgi:hypothetical protein